jgi:exopolysaccharide biosynthesis polyprenyl glycosylphosphotransferase
MAPQASAVSQASALPVELSGCGPQSGDFLSPDHRIGDSQLAGFAVGALRARRGSRWCVGLGAAALLAAAAGAAMDVPDVRIAPSILAVVAIVGAGCLAFGFWRLLRPQVAVLGDRQLADQFAASLGGAGRGELLGVFRSSGLVEHGVADDALLRAVNRGDVDVVAVALPPAQEEAADRIVGRLSALAVDVAVYDVAADSVATAGADPLPAPRRVVRRPLNARQRVMKDIEDRLLGVVLLVLLMPVLALVALAVKLSSPGPVLFKQKRHGFRGQEILVYKFRTMRRDAADYSGRNQTQRGDPRITRIGRILRSTSLDELPQLLNVVRGEMSLVGPRPHPIDMRTNGELCQEIVHNYESRHRVRPGITGWAQINGYRGATTTREQVEGRVRLDNHYIDNWSLLFDLRIMALTAVRLFADENAF